jgi:transposase InsO family protein
MAEPFDCSMCWMTSTGKDWVLIWIFHCLATESFERRNRSSNGVVNPTSFNGPEYVSGAVNQWAQQRGIRIDYIQPGKPQQNAYVERYNRTVRYDWLSQTLFSSISEAQDSAARWLWTYNHERPNMAIGGIRSMQKLAMAA